MAGYRDKCAFGQDFGTLCSVAVICISSNKPNKVEKVSQSLVLRPKTFLVRVVVLRRRDSLYYKVL